MISRDDDTRAPLTIWHLTHAEDWAAAQAVGSYTTSTRGASLADVGFLHASYPDQLEPVALAVYADDPAPLVALEIPLAALTAHGITVRDEAGDPSHPDVLYPHVYGPLPTEAVAAAHPARIETGPTGPRLVVGNA